MLRIFLFILILSAGGMSTAAEKTRQSASQSYLDAYLQINDGERLEKDGRFREAYAAYSGGSQQLKALCTANPSNSADLQPMLIKLDAKLGELKKRIGN